MLKNTLIKTLPMNLEEFVSLVEKMREAQKEADKFKSPSLFGISKKLEREVDSQISSYYKLKTEDDQPRFF